ncbi:18996_t:CDS:2 [Funneliformis geosporum]|uniref:18996_t:CDS:1 n=1 Tax=Funneliformis geosporum TaxID=1117311 RepID=A0A9W4SDQ6_9GLOM|nr:18996_t:CDS:2 [Funneliformis geosporum]
MGGIINAGFQKTCLICQEIVGLEFSNECQCEKKNSHCKYCQSSDIDKKNCSCQKEKQLSELEAKIVQSKKGETELEESFEKQRLGLESVRKKAIKSRKGEKNNDRLQIERNNLQQMKGFRQRTLTNGTSNEQIKPNLKYLIDRGGYGELQEVAVKKLYLPIHIASESDIKVIKKEIEILKDLRNRYIIQYYGVYSDDQGFLIIMDYAENGTLTKFVNDNKNKEHD